MADKFKVKVVDNSVHRREFRVDIEGHAGPHPLYLWQTNDYYHWAWGFEDLPGMGWSPRFTTEKKAFKWLRRHTQALAQHCVDMAAYRDATLQAREALRDRTMRLRQLE